MKSTVKGENLLSSSSVALLYDRKMIDHSIIKHYIESIPAETSLEILIIKTKGIHYFANLFWYFDVFLTVHQSIDFFKLPT